MLHVFNSKHMYTDRDWMCGISECEWFNGFPLSLTSWCERPVSEVCCVSWWVSPWSWMSVLVWSCGFWRILGTSYPGNAPSWETHTQQHSLIHYLATINISQMSVLCITLCLLFPLPVCVFGRWAWILYTQVDIDCKVCNNKYDYYLSSSFSLSSSCSMTALSSM